jgi:integrase
MLRLDREAAGIPHVAEGPDGPSFADFHALRHSFIALLDRSGATLKEAMQLARHSAPKLTMAVYGPAQLNEMFGVWHGNSPRPATLPLPFGMEGC